MPDDPKVFVIRESRDDTRQLQAMLEKETLRVEAFTSIDHFLQAPKWTEAGCIVVELDLSGNGGIAHLQKLFAAVITVPVIVVTPRPDTRSCISAVRMGVYDILDRPLDSQDCVRSVRRALDHHLKSAQSAASAYVCEALKHITPRQKEILDLLVNGKSLKEIAVDCKITVQTVWKHRQTIRKKFGIVNDVELTHLMVARSLALRPGSRRGGASP